MNTICKDCCKTSKISTQEGRNVHKTGLEFLAGSSLKTFLITLVKKEKGSSHSRLWISVMSFPLSITIDVTGKETEWDGQRKTANSGLTKAQLASGCPFGLRARLPGYKSLRLSSVSLPASSPAGGSQNAPFGFTLLSQRPLSVSGRGRRRLCKRQAGTYSSPPFWHSSSVKKIPFKKDFLLFKPSMLSRTCVSGAVYPVIPGTPCLLLSP